MKSTNKYYKSTCPQCGAKKLEAEISQNQKTADMLMQAVLKEAFNNK